MGLGGDSRMDERERAAFAAAKEAMEAAGRGRPKAAPEPGKPLTKAMAAKLGKEMSAACARGDQEVALELLMKGAAPNARDPEGASCLEVALEACAKGVDMHEFAKEAVRRGAFVGPGRHTGLSAAFTALAGGAPPTPELLREVVGTTLARFCSDSREWGAVEAAYEALAGPGSSGPALAGLAKRGRVDVLAQASKAGVELGEAVVDHLVLALESQASESKGGGVFAEESAGDLACVVAKAAEAGELGDGSVFKLFSMAAAAGKAGGIVALLSAGLRPGPDWSVRMVWTEKEGWRERAHAQRGSLLLAAAISPWGRGAFDALKAFAPAVEAAAATKPPPRALAQAAVGKLMELKELGVDISGRDEVGGVAHWWAKLDEKPRDGWAMLAAKAPEVFEMANSRGEAAATVMAAKLAGSDRDAFLASVSKIEGREIRREVKAPKAAPKAAGRGRL